jgi:PAS domain S-box-containing protein
VGKTDFDFFANEHAQQALADEQEIMRTGQPVLDKEEKETWPDGRETWVSTTKMPLRDASRYIIGTFGISRDITERKRAEEALVESEERFRSLVENATVGIYRTTPDGCILMANPALIRMLGYDTFQELATRDLEREGFEPSYPRSAFRERIEREGEVTGLEAAWKRRDGSVIHVRESAHAVRASDGRVLYYDGVVEDVTEHHRAEEALRESEEKHRTLFETMAQGAVYQNAEGHIISANPSAERLLGLRLAEMLGRTSMDPRWKAIHEDGSDFPGDTHPAMIALKTGKEILHVVMGVFHPGANEYVWINIHAVPQFRPGETKPYQVYTTFDDITARKQAEEALRHQNEMQQTILDSIPVMIAFLDRESRHHLVNRCWQSTLGWSLEEVQHKDILAQIYPDPAYLEYVRDYIAAAAGTWGDFKSRTRDGRILDTSWVNVPLSDGSNIGIGIDITERKRAEEALRLSQEMFQKAFHASPDTMVLHTLSEGRHIDVNESFLRLIGYRREELVGRTAMDLGLWWDLAQRNEYLRILREQGRVRDLEICVRTKSGEARTLLLSAEVVEIAGQDSVVAIGKDISERKQAEQERMHLEEQLRQAQKMEAVGRLAGGVAHDFNNILMVINGYAQLVLRRLSPRHPMRQRLNEIRKAGERAASLTRQLLAFSRRQILVPRILDLNKAVADTKEMLRRVIGEDVELVIRQGHKLAKVLADPGQIEQVLVNLAVNARDAMPGGGRLTIETGNVDLREAETGELPGAAPGPYVMLAVSDTGAGMSKEVMEHMFEPFFTTREQGKGTGLGLSMVYGIVKQSGGYVRAQSEPGHGSAFRIYLPCAPVGSGKPAARSTKARLARGRETVLVVEDELAVRQVVAAALRSSGYKVLEAGSGEETMRRLRRHEGPLHLVLTDLVMPRMNGRQVADSVRTLYPEVKVVFMSGYTDDALLRHGVSDTQALFLQKPFTMETLTQKVREALGPSQ